uniref:Uncharacterized protein n=1 Tax=Solanum tuberosum TaxID=4113 RepID=M1BMJ1_SOLTU
MASEVSLFYGVKQAHQAIKALSIGKPLLQSFKKTLHIVTRSLCVQCKKTVLENGFETTRYVHTNNCQVHF